MNRALPAVASTFLAAGLPGDAFGHASERGIVLLLPTGYYMAAGATAVALTFLIVMLVPRPLMARVFAIGRIAMPRWRVPPVPSLVALAMALGLVAAGLLGERDPARNPLPLTVWTLWWIGLTLASAIFGDLWRRLNPWSGAMWLLRRAGMRPLLRLPGWVARWPAILWFAAFAWFELVHIAPDDPARLALACLTYWATTLAAMILFGEARWRRQGECFAIFFGLVARLAPVRTRPGSLRVALPGAHAAAPPALDPTGALFLLLALASVTFDGFRETFLWLSLIGINPLEFPGRSAVVAENSLGLLLAWAVLTAGFAAAVALGLRLARVRHRFRASFGRLALSLIPIALGYHIAHYLTQLLVYGQHIAELATDPLHRGDDLLGLGAYFMTTSFLYDHDSAERLWQVQSGAIVLGHVAAVLIARRASLDLHDTPRAALLAEIPLAGLMVAYTLLGLWLLSTPVA